MHIFKSGFLFAIRIITGRLTLAILVLIGVYYLRTRRPRAYIPFGSGQTNSDPDRAPSNTSEDEAVPIEKTLVEEDGTASATLPYDGHLPATGYESEGSLEPGEDTTFPLQTSLRAQPEIGLGVGEPELESSHLLVAEEFGRGISPAENESERNYAGSAEFQTPGVGEFDLALDLAESADEVLNLQAEWTPEHEAQLPPETDAPLGSLERSVLGGTEPIAGEAATSVDGAVIDTTGLGRAGPLPGSNESEGQPADELPAWIFEPYDYDRYEQEGDTVALGRESRQASSDDAVSATESPSDADLRAFTQGPPGLFIRNWLRGELDSRTDPPSDVGSPGEVPMEQAWLAGDAVPAVDGFESAARTRSDGSAQSFDGVSQSREDSGPSAEASPTVTVVNNEAETGDVIQESVANVGEDTAPTQDLDDQEQAALHGNRVFNVEPTIEPSSSASNFDDEAESLSESVAPTRQIDESQSSENVLEERERSRPSSQGRIKRWLGKRTGALDRDRINQRLDSSYRDRDPRSQEQSPRGTPVKTPSGEVPATTTQAESMMRPLETDPQPDAETDLNDTVVITSGEKLTDSRREPTFIRVRRPEKVDSQ
jgi:hypothetical protein